MKLWENSLPVAWFYAVCLIWVGPQRFQFAEICSVVDLLCWKRQAMSLADMPAVSILMALTLLKLHSRPTWNDVWHHFFSSFRAHNKQFSLFPQCFLLAWRINLLAFPSNWKLLSVNSFSLKESKIRHLGTVTSVGNYVHIPLPEDKIFSLVQIERKLYISGVFVFYHTHLVFLVQSTGYWTLNIRLVTSILKFV